MYAPNDPSAKVFESALQRPLPGVPDVESPFFDEIFAKKNLDPETRRIVDSVREKGYATLQFPLDDFDAFADRLIEEIAPSYQTGRIQDAWKFNDRVKLIAAHPRILEILEVLFGRRPIPFQTLNFYVGTQQSYHSDAIHFSSVPERFMCGVWVALEEIDDDNGPLIYFPGSHKWPIYTNEHVGVNSTNVEYQAGYPRFEALWRKLVEVHGAKQETLRGKKGTALVWAANLLHGGAKQNDMSRTRHSQVTHYYFDDCVYYTPMNSDPAYGSTQYRFITDITTGERVANRYCGEDVSRWHIEYSLNYRVMRYGGMTLDKFARPS